jgi:hypothetical protein
MRSHILPFTSIIILFFISRGMAFMLGVRTITNVLDYAPHMLDLQLLQTRLWESLFFLHSQPPLFNLYVGLVLQLFPEHSSIVFYLISLFWGLALVLALYGVMTLLGVHLAIRGILTLLVILNPANILYESIVFYTIFLTSLLCLVVLCLLLALRTRHPVYLFAFAGMLVALNLTAAIFHVLWIIAICAAVVLVMHPRWRTALLLALPLVLIGGVYIKNIAVFDLAGSSSFLGMNVARTMEYVLPPTERTDLVEQGIVSPLALVPAFSRVSAYTTFIDPGAPTGIPALDQQERTSGFPNLNHRIYIDVSERYLSDTITLIRAYPHLYIRGAMLSSGVYFVPASRWGTILEPNRQQIASLDRFYNVVFYGQPVYVPPDATGNTRLAWHSVGLSLVVGLPLLLLYGTWRGWKAMRQEQQAAALTIFFLCLTILYITLVGVLFEQSENNRFRFMIDPLLVVLLGVALSDALRWVASIAVPPARRAHGSHGRGSGNG